MSRFARKSPSVAILISLSASVWLFLSVLAKQQSLAIERSGSASHPVLKEYAHFKYLARSDCYYVWLVEDTKLGQITQ